MLAGTAEAVAMPQVKRSSRGAGLHVPGVREALLLLELDRFERSERTAARMKAEYGTFCRRNNGRLIERLDAGETVTVNRATVESALWQRDRPPRPARLPFDREVRAVRVSPDDRIVPAASRAEI